MTKVFSRMNDVHTNTENVSKLRNEEMDFVGATNIRYSSLVIVELL